MKAHDFHGDEDVCGKCLRPPGNYIHVGISDEQHDGSWRNRFPGRGDGGDHVEPPAVLRS